MKTEKSAAAFARAEKVIPGGVNSPVRAFGSVGGTPRFIERGEGAAIFDCDGNFYIDYVCSWGPLILGHAHPGVIEAVTRAAAKGTSFGAAAYWLTRNSAMSITTIRLPTSSFCVAVIAPR